MANLVSTVFDADTKGFRAGMKNLIADVRGADGLMGKFKAGVSGAGGVLKDNMGAAAMAAGTALVAFAVKSVAAFEDTAKAAIDMGKAVGLGTEDASRWIAVGDDMGVTADQLTAAFGKVGKSLNSGAWEKYGVATRDAAGEARSTNDILLDSFDALSKIPNQTERAAAGNALFGKGYANLAPLIGKSRDEMEKYLGSVESGQVITDKEAAKAEKMRLAQDKLSDALREVSLATGEFVANLAPMISALADVVTWTTSVQDAQEGWARDLVGLGDDVALGLGKITNAQASVNAGTADYSRIIEDFNSGTGAEYKKTLDEAAKATKAADAALQTLKGHLDEKQAWINAQQAVDDMRAKIADGGSSWRDLQTATIDAASSVADFVATTTTIPDEVKTNIYAALDQGNLDGVLTFLDAIAKGIDLPIYPKIKGGGINPATGGQLPGVPKFDDGGVMPGPIGQHNLAYVAGGETVLPTHKTGRTGSGAGNITVIVQGADERAVIDRLNRWQARGGRV